MSYFLVTRRASGALPTIHSAPEDLPLAAAAEQARDAARQRPLGPSLRARLGAIMRGFR